MKHALLHTAVRTALFAALVLALNACSGCGAEPTDPADDDDGRSEALRELHCSNDRVSKLELVIDFHDHVTRAMVDSFAASHGLYYRDTVRLANTHILAIDRVARPHTDVHELGRYLRLTYPDLVLFVEPLMIVAIWDDYYRWEDLKSTERVVVEFREEPSSALLDSFASAHGLDPYPEGEWPAYVRTFAETLAGTHTVVWDGKDSAGRQLGAGVYFIRLTTPVSRITQRVALVR